MSTITRTRSGDVQAVLILWKRCGLPKAGLNAFRSTVLVAREVLSGSSSVSGIDQDLSGECTSDGLAPGKHGAERPLKQDASFWRHIRLS